VIKLAGNFLLAAAIEAMGEAFALARKYGVAPAELLDIVNGRLFRSPIYENYGKLIAEERYEPARVQAEVRPEGVSASRSAPRTRSPRRCRWRA